MTLIGHLQARVAGVGPGGGGCVYEARLSFQGPQSRPVSGVFFPGRHVGQGYTIPCLSSEATAGVGLGVGATAWQ